jgi:chemotaxis signal transduction protein
MNLGENAARDSFVLLHLANRRFALPARLVAELAPPVRLHSFPHTSPLLAGVIVRRGRIVPVYDAARVFSGKTSLANRFYLVARRQFGAQFEMSAIPVDGECELISGELLPRQDNAPFYVSGEIFVGDQPVAVLDLEELVQFRAEGSSTQQITAQYGPEARA